MRPDDTAQFRHARLVLLLLVVAEWDHGGVDAERLAIYDFLAEHPLLLARRGDDPDRFALRLAGFDDRALAYASPAQRFTAARLCLARDLAALIGQGLVRVTAAGRVRYRLTPEGVAVANQFNSTYAHAYMTAGRIVVRRVRRLSGRGLRENLRQWLTPVADMPVGALHAADVSGDDDDLDASGRGGRPGRTTYPKGTKRTAIPRGRA
ncbi:MAG TPA: hypothetical protein VJT31_25825 [Rugosimonospora sp.]|nr:hypothetical protein [Rugosimonospora sp.]